MVAFQGIVRTDVEGRCVSCYELWQWLGERIKEGKGGYAVAVQDDEGMCAFFPETAEGGDRGGVIVLDATAEVG